MTIDRVECPCEDVNSRRWVSKSTHGLRTDPSTTVTYRSACRRGDDEGEIFLATEFLPKDIVGLSEFAQIQAAWMARTDDQDAFRWFVQPCCHTDIQSQQLTGRGDVQA